MCKGFAAVRRWKSFLRQNRVHRIRPGLNEFNADKIANLGWCLKMH